MKTNQIQADMQALENRYGAGFAQYLADQMAAVSARPIEFLDVKHLNDTVAEHRARICDLVASCRAAGNGAETALLRRQIAEMRDVYRSALLDSRVMMAEYMRRLKTDSVDAMRIITAKAA